MSKEPLHRSDVKGVKATQVVEQGSLDVGSELRMARRRRGIDLVTAAQDLKIREHYLRALEDSDHTALPGPPYTVGFVRNYADYVGLDGSNIVRRFKDEIKRLEVKPKFTWIKPIQENHYAGGLIFFLSLFLATAVYAGWYYQTADARKPAVAADAAIRQGAFSVASAAAGAVREVPRFAPIDHDEARPADIGNDASVSAGRGYTGDRQDSEQGEDASAIPTLDIGKIPIDIGAGPDQEVQKAAKPSATTIKLKALGVVWLRVRSRQTRQVIAERTMKKGEVLVLPKNPGLVLDVGRASQIEILIGDRSVGTAGRSMHPRHNLSLHPQRLLRGG